MPSSYRLKINCLVLSLLFIFCWSLTRIPSLDRSLMKSMTKWYYYMSIHLKNMENPSSKEVNICIIWPSETTSYSIKSKLLYFTCQGSFNINACHVWRWIHDLIYSTHISLIYSLLFPYLISHLCQHNFGLVKPFSPWSLNIVNCGMKNEECSNDNIFTLRMTHYYTLL